MALAGPDKDERIASLQQRVECLEAENKQLRTDLVQERFLNKLTMEPQKKRLRVEETAEIGENDENEDIEENCSFDELSPALQRKVIDPIVNGIIKTASKYKIEPKRLIGRLMGKYNLFDGANINLE